MPLASIAHCRFAGLSAVVPKGVASNLDYAAISPEERQKLIKATGIEMRRVVDAATCTSDLCFAAARQLLAALQWSPDEVQALIFVTQTPDYLFPATSPILQDRLRLPKSCLTLDISLGCSGYVYGLAALAGLVSSMRLGKALLLVGEVPTKNVAPSDRTVTPLFGDAGTATALAYDETAPPLHFDLCSDGSGYKAIIVPDGGKRNFFTAESLVEYDAGNGIRRNRTHVVLDGAEVFNFSVREVPLAIRRLLQFAGVDQEQVDQFVLHQANLMMNEVIRKKLKIPPERHPYTLREFGNTSSATVPLTLAARCREALTAGPQTLLLCGFGIGLSWGTALVRTDRIVCTGVSEL